MLRVLPGITGRHVHTPGRRTHNHADYFSDRVKMMHDRADYWESEGWSCGGEIISDTVIGGIAAIFRS